MSRDTKPSSSPDPRTVRTGERGVHVALVDPRDAGSAPAASYGARYRAHGVLGRGGMGDVRLVEDCLIGREIAVKTIAQGLADSQGMRERFLREIRIQGQLEHPSIVPVYDLGVDEHGHEYFTMKRIAGRTLGSVIRALAAGDEQTQHAFPRSALLAMFRQVCLCVAYAHARGVVHRDLKPANVMIGDFGEVYVLDWGIARLVEEPASDGEHGDDEILGTPGYMAPEQLASSRDADERADVYSLGAILFEILVLEPWHEASSAAAAIASTAMHDEARPSQRAPRIEVPPELDDLCARATASERRNRLATARELAETIERYLEGDRDLERRRAQARQHAKASRAARDRMASNGTDAVDARREALREAGRAVALDPDEPEALTAAIELMLEPPREVPSEVRDELDRAQSDRIRAGLVPGIAVFASFMIAALIIPFVTGPVSWSVPLGIAASLAIAIGLCVTLLRKRELSADTSTTLLIAVCAAVAIALASGYLGTMIVIPPLAVALANALAASQRQWRAFVVVSALAVIVPFTLEWAGLVAPNYAFGSDGFMVQPVVMKLPEVPIRLLSMFATLGALIGSVYYVRRVVLVEAELRRSWVLQNWHLQQMTTMRSQRI